MNSYSVSLLVAGQLTGPARYWAGGRGSFAVWADFEGSGGGTVIMEWLGPDGQTWIQANDLAGAPIELTVPDSSNFELPPCQIRAVADSPDPTVAIAARL